MPIILQGDNCLKMIVCSGKINPVYSHRCQEYGVMVIKQDQIQNLIPMLRKYIRRHLNSLELNVKKVELVSLFLLFLFE